MTDREICIMYREAKNRNAQVQVLAELNCTGRMEIIKILLCNGEELTPRIVALLYRRLDTLDAQIAAREREYREIVQMLEGGKSGHGTDI